MKELTDYTASLKTDLKWEDFSKEFLVKLMRFWQWHFLQQSEEYDNAVQKRLGVEAVHEMEAKAWARIPGIMGPRFLPLAKIQLNTISDCIKVLQLYPYSILSDMYDADIDVKSDTHAIFTVTKCLTLEYYEREAPHMIEPICHKHQAKCLEAMLLHPKAKVTPIQLPPLPPQKRSPDAPCVCQFDLKLES